MQSLIGCINEHWLFSCEHTCTCKYSNSISRDYFWTCTSSPDVESSSYILPQASRGHGGVAILWHKLLDKFIKLPRSDRIVGVKS